MALLATVRAHDARRLRAALEQTFAFRGTHALPSAVPVSPESWQTPYAAMARADQLPWPTLDAVTRAAQEFLDPVLGGSGTGTWNATMWRWQPG